MIESVLIANRGEIALRVIATCRRLGIRTVAVYSDADARAPHVAEADSAVCIGPAPAVQSYLSVEALLAAGRISGAQAIHPGYGFLSENADFAQATLDAGLIWVGPSPGAMRALGDKARARRLAEEHGVPLLPGYHGDDQSVATLRQHAGRIGYPVLIKAAAGGGGRGMRVVDSADAFAAALEAAQREALASFGDGRVVLEQYVRRPRHIEMQIFGDQHGHLVHLGERECSIQRRHQKLVEESPSPAVDADLRSRMGDAALRLASAADYTNAGTAEFLLDENRQFVFLEVNARLQVEHPVTEAITGLDLVEWQLRVAAGEPLPVAQDDIAFNGHAIEVRVVAEDALTGFLPSSGTIERFERPSSVRVDTWVDDGTVVSPFYDSLLAKVIAHERSRTAAARRLAGALAQTWIDGVATNLDLLLAIVEQPAFLDGDLHTGFLQEHQLLESVGEVPPRVLAAVSALDALAPSPTDDPWLGTSTWRVARVDQPASWSRAGREHSATVSAALDGSGVDVCVGSDVLHVMTLGSRFDHRRRVSVDGDMLTVTDHPHHRVVESGQHRYRFRAARPIALGQVTRGRGIGGVADPLSAPMPARVVKLAVAVGDHVRQNQPLVVLEAMKMEHIVEAPHAAVVAEICVAVGDQVQGGVQLLVLGPAAGSGPAE